MRGKENDIDFLHFIKQHDIVTLLETWSNEPKDFQTLSDSLSEFDTPLVKHGVKLSKHGRLSSGILVYIKHSLSHLIKYSSDFECGIICELSEQLLGYPTLFIACYLPPSGSNFYNRLQTSGISLLENKLNELRASHPGYKFIISGDLNARTNNLQDFIQDDSSKFLPLPDFYPESSFCINRKSKDIHGEVNEFGKALLELCCTFDIHMLNGRAKGDKNGELTCFTATGSSRLHHCVSTIF